MPETPMKHLDVVPRLSQAVVANGFVYTAGVIPDDATQDVAGQTRQILAKIDDLLKRAGTDKSKAVSATIYLPALADFAAMNSVWDAWVTPGRPPARACVIAGLVNPAWRVEISVTAAI
jgi:enamine deaminase RidA (YjgF/YER057c/UK114 family)